MVGNFFFTGVQQNMPNTTKRPWEPERAISASLAQALLEEQFPNLAPIELKLLGAGWDNTAFLVNQNYVFRFPRRKIAVDLLKQEAKVLLPLAGSLSLKVPIPHRQGVPSKEFPWPFSGYQVIEGKTACSAELNEEQRIATAVPLASFLKTLHNVPKEKIVSWEVPDDLIGRLDIEKRAPRMQEYLKEAEGHNFPMIKKLGEKIIDQSAKKKVSYRKSLVHGDLYARHLVIDQERVLSGVIDWGDVHFGNPAIDLAIVFSFLPPGGQKIFWENYGAVGEEILSLAKFKALYSSLTILCYGKSIGDKNLAKEASVGIKYISECV